MRISISKLKFFLRECAFDLGKQTALGISNCQGYNIEYSSLKIVSEMLRWEGQKIHKSCLRNQEMQISLGVTSDEMSSLQHPAEGFEEDAQRLPAKPHICHLPEPMCLVNTAAGVNLASNSLSSSLLKCLLMAKFKLKIFRQEILSVLVVCL